MIDIKEFVKQPVEIEAAQYLGPFQQDDFLEWIGENARINYTDDVVGVLEIGTLEGVMRVDPSDWVIKGVEGEFYPCKPAIFVKTYREKSPDLESTTLYAGGQPVAKITTGPTGFQKELQSLINKHSLENGSDTPDFILASFLENVLVDWNHATRTRDRWRMGT
jgi:hypothetical protein